MGAKRHILEHCAAVLAAFLVLANCTPQARLQHLLKKYPQLVNSTQIDTLYLPGAMRDTTIYASTNTGGLDSILDHYLWQLDSMQMRPAKAAIKNYVINRPCLEDTLLINLSNRGYCKVWQTGGKFHFSHKLNAQSIEIRRPLVNVTMQPKIVRFWLGLFVGVFGMVLLIAAYQKLK